jgi:hypothetical protein
MMTLIQHPHVLISRINTSENPIYEMINAINFPLNYPCTIVCRAPSFRSSPKMIQSNQLKPMLQQRSVGAGGDGSWTSVESVYKAAEERLDGSYCGCRASASAPAARVSPWGRRCAHGHQPWLGCVFYNHQLNVHEASAACRRYFASQCLPASALVPCPCCRLRRLAVHLPGALLPSRFTNYRYNIYYACAKVPNFCSPLTCMTPEFWRLSRKRLLNSLVLHADGEPEHSVVYPSSIQY